MSRKLAIISRLTALAARVLVGHRWHLSPMGSNYRLCTVPVWIASIQCNTGMRCIMAYNRPSRSTKLRSGNATERPTTPKKKRDTSGGVALEEQGVREVRAPKRLRRAYGRSRGSRGRGSGRSVRQQSREPPDATEPTWSAAAIPRPRKDDDEGDQDGSRVVACAMVGAVSA